MDKFCPQKKNNSQPETESNQSPCSEMPNYLFDWRIGKLDVTINKSHTKIHGYRVSYSSVILE
jgi:hypothetical protein